MSKKILCVHCGSNSFIKKGYADNARIFLCKNCGKRFKIKAADLVGTAYALDTTSTTVTKKETIVATKAQPKITKNKEAVIIDKTTPESTKSITTITENTSELINDIDLGKVKKDKNGNFLMRIGNNPPMPIGTSKNDLVSIVRKHGGSCTLTLGNDGIFVLKITTTTKG